MNILYISKSVIPSRSANSIHVMKMCQAFADNGHRVVLLSPEIKDQYEKNVSDIFNYYGVKKNFSIKKLFHPNFKGGAFFYTIAIFIYLIVNKRFDLIYGRFLHGIYVSTLLKNKVVYETHLPASEENNHRLFIFKINKCDNYLYSFDKYVDCFNLCTDNVNKDTLTYIYTICHKTEWVKKAIQFNLFEANNYIWVDFGIRHVFQCDDFMFKCKIENLQ